MFFPEILNRVTEYSHNNPNISSSTICNTLESAKLNLTIASENTVIKLGFATYEYTFMLEIIYAIGFALIGVLVNRLGKLLIIISILFTCALCAVAISIVSTTTLSIYLYVILLACGLSINVINASTIEIYPTSLR